MRVSFAVLLALVASLASATETDGNCRFYESLTVILETHGTNRNGLKLQRSHDPEAERS